MNTGQSQPKPAHRPLRIGFISARPLDDPNHLSGMPHSMATALAKLGFEIVPFITDRPTGPTRVHRKALNRLRTLQKQLCVTPIRKWLDDRAPSKTRRRVIDPVTLRSIRIECQLAELERLNQLPDAIFGCCISSSLYALETNLPIIYFSDATSYIIRDTYPGLMNRGEAHIQTLHQVEHTSLKRTSSAIFASPIVRDSAIKDLGINPESTHVVPMGAHVTPADPTVIEAPTPPPTRDHCDLLIVASDPIRKRVDLALDATEILRQRGINATLHIVGPGTPRSNASTAAKPLGRLQLSDPNDRQTHQQLLRDCHIQLLPSLGEAFGSAPIESAHFARPSIVANAGGLPFVVLHNKTGLVIDRDESPVAWADAIESLIDNPDHYRDLSRNALQRARDELNWDAWGHSVAKIITETIATQR